MKCKGCKKAVTGVLVTRLYDHEQMEQERIFCELCGRVLRKTTHKYAIKRNVRGTRKGEAFTL